MKMWTTKKYAVLALSIPMLILGCSEGGGDAPKDLIEVSGRVVQGDKPVENALVLFTPSGAAGPSTGKTNADGEFNLQYTDGRPGAVMGDHKVQITVGGMPAAEATGGDGPPSAVPAEPKEYFTNADVGADAKTLKFDLNSL